MPGEQTKEGKEKKAQEDRRSESKEVKLPMYSEVTRREGMVKYSLVQRASAFLNSLVKNYDKTGKIAINPQFDLADDFQEGLARIKLGDKWGYIDKNGKRVINPQFEDAKDFQEGLARVQLGSKWGYIDKNGNRIINPQFDYAWDFKEGLAGIQLGDKYGYIDKNGKIVSKP